MLKHLLLENCLCQAGLVGKLHLFLQCIQFDCEESTNMVHKNQIFCLAY